MLVKISAKLLRGICSCSFFKRTHVIIVLDTQRINQALSSIETILTKLTSFETKMAIFEETVIAAFGVANAQIELLKTQNASLSGELEVTEAELTAAAEKVAAAEKAFAELTASEEAEDQAEKESQDRILAAAAPFLPTEPTA